jgi:hypothetical protein
MKISFCKAIFFLAFAAGIAAVANARRDRAAQTFAACAAFSRDGTATAATINSIGLTLEVTDPAGKMSQLQRPLRYPAAERDARNPSGQLHFYSCVIYIDGPGDLAAVGIKSGITGSQLQVAVADLKALKWIGDWGIPIHSGFASPSLAGFLEETDSLVVAGEPPMQTQYGQGTHWGLLTTALFDPSGKQLNPPRTQRYAQDGQLYQRYPDASHDRLWVALCETLSAPWSRQPLCPVASTSLIGDQRPSFQVIPSLQGKKRTDLWFSPETFAAADSNTLLFAEGSSIWRVNVQTQTIERLGLPKRSLLPNVRGTLGAAALSPDAQIIAIGLPKYRPAFPFLVDNYVYQGTDIAVIELHPFRVLRILPQNRTAYRNQFAVDHRKVRTTVLLYRQDHWERDEVTESTRP